MALSAMAAAGGCLHLVGLGLGDEKDITVKGLETIRRCKGIYLEGYTSILGVDIDRLSEFYERPVTLMDREAVETECDKMLDQAKTEEVAFLVVGDVYGATTHTDMAVRAKERGIKVSVIHNASIMNACSACGLQLYNFGQTVSICFFTETWKPDSFIDKVLVNKRAGMHTLALLDIKVKEQSEENMARGRKIYEPPRYMTVNQACEQILEVIRMRGSSLEGIITPDTLVVGIARVGHQDQCIASGPLSKLKDFDFGGPLHSMVIVGDMHYLEEEMLRSFHFLEGGKTGFEKGPDGRPLQPSAASLAPVSLPADEPAQAEAGGGLLAMAAQILSEPDAEEKVRLTREARAKWVAGELDLGERPTGKGAHCLRAEPARPAKVQMVESRKVQVKSRASFVHSLVHAESYAIDLMWDLMLRFQEDDLPRGFYEDWCKVAFEEATHYSSWRDRLKEMGHEYGDFPAHDSLWESAAETSHDLLARLAIVHMVHEARGLDVAEAGLAKFQKSNPPDEVSASILRRNVEEETTHVGAAVKWFKHTCGARGLKAPPHEVFHSYVRRFFRGKLRAPFNKEARLAAGMTEEWYMPLAEGAEEEAAASVAEEAKEESDGELEMDAGALDDFFDAINDR